MLALLETVADRIGQLIERRRAEAAVAESEARKSAVLSSALDCIITIDSANRILEFNPAAEHTFGYRAQDVLGKDMADLLIPPELREDHRSGLRRQLENPGGRLLGNQVELTGMRAGGELFPIELAVTRIDTDDLPLFTAFVRDITDRKRSDEELRRSRARIVKAADEARRRLERNLHDGAQQRLVSLSLSLRLAQSMTQRDPGAADGDPGGGQRGAVAGAGGAARAGARHPPRDPHRPRPAPGPGGAGDACPAAGGAGRRPRPAAAARRSRRPPTTSWRRRSRTLPSTPTPNTLRSA